MNLAHMDVVNNVAYPLQNMKASQDEIVAQGREDPAVVHLRASVGPATRLFGRSAAAWRPWRGARTEPQGHLFDERFPT
jgi:hypothetical protein